LDELGKLYSLTPKEIAMATKKKAKKIPAKKKPAKKKK